MLIDTLQVHVINQETQSLWKDIKDYLSIITLLIGILIGYGIDRWKERKRFVIVREYFFYSLFNLNKGVKEQINSYREYIKIVKSDNTNIPRLRVINNFTTSIIKNVSNDDLYKILVLRGIKKVEPITLLEKLHLKKREKDKYYIKNLNTLNIGFIKIEDILSTYKQEDENLSKLYEYSIKIFNELQSKLKLELDKILNIDSRTATQTQIELINNINKIGNRFEKSRTTKKENTIFKTMRGFVLPIKKLFDNNIHSTINPILDEMVYTYNMLKSTRKSFAEHLEINLKDLETINTFQEILLNKYDEYVNKDLIQSEEEITKFNEEQKNALNKKGSNTTSNPIQCL